MSKQKKIKKVKKESLYFTEDKKFKDAVLTDEILKEYHVFTDPKTDVMYIYDPNEGLWTEGEKILINICLNKLGAVFKKNYVDAVLYRIRAITYSTIEEQSSNLIPFKNYIYDINTRRVISYSPDYKFFNKLNAEYQPNTVCSKFLKFIDDVCQEDDKQALQEFCGSVLQRSYWHRKALMLVGSGSNGKSTLGEVITKILGKENTSSRTLQELGSDKFAIESLFRKYANISSELPSTSLKDTGTFKALTGMDSITGQKKFGQPFDFTNYAKLIFSCNIVPESNDESEAYFDRWILISFLNQFYPGDGKCDPNILEKLTTPEEMSGIVNWMLEGLERLIENKGFSISRDIEDVREEYIALSDTVQKFINDYITFETDNSLIEKFMPKDELYKDFVLYCKSEKYPIISKENFGRKLRQKIKGLQTVRRVYNNIGVQCWNRMIYSMEGIEKSLKKHPEVLETSLNSALNDELDESLDNPNDY